MFLTTLAIRRPLIVLIGIGALIAFGLLAWTRAVLPAMRARHESRIVNLSSVGGFSATAGFGVYAATKFAVEGLSEAMQVELRPLGIDVIIVEPGVFRTDFLDPTSLQCAARIIDDYASTSGTAREWAAATNHEQWGDPAKAAAAIVEVATSPSPPLRLQLGADSVSRIEAKLHRVPRELIQWRAVAVSTGYSGKPTNPHHQP